MDTSSSDDIVERLDRLLILLSIAFAEPIERFRAELASDPVAAAILAAVRDDWVLSGDLQRDVCQATGVAPRTVQRAIASLSERRLLVNRGSGKATSCRSSGVL